MMISPEGFIKELREKTYMELLPVRDELIRSMHSFENRREDNLVLQLRPSPETVYQCNLQYLAALCELIAEKYNSEIVWGIRNNTK